MLGLKSVHGSLRKASSSLCGRSERCEDIARARNSESLALDMSGSSERNFHWSGYGTSLPSTKQALPTLLLAPCSGSAIRFPKPPFGSLSWLGKILSYDPSPTSGFRSMAKVSTYVRTSRTNRAGCGSSKKNQRCAPFPERDLSRATGSPSSPRTSHIDELSVRQVDLSRSIAANLTVSSARSG